MKGIIFNQSKKVLEKVNKEMPIVPNEFCLIKTKGFCINRADILETKGKY